MIELKKILLELNVVIDNKYLDNYINLIQANLNNPKHKYLTQKHHIIPRYYYRKNNLIVNNEKNNIVNLSHYDHLLAHYYLYLCSSDIYKYNNGYALNHLLTAGNKNFKLNINIEDIPDIDAELFNNILIETNKQRALNTAEQHKRGLHHISQEQREKLSAIGKGRIWIVNEKEERHLIREENLNDYLSLGFIKGKYFDKSINPHLNMKRSAETCKKISERAKGKYHKPKDPNQKSKKLSEALRGRQITWKDKIKETNKKKRVWTDGTIVVISEICPGANFYIGRPKNPKQQNRIWCNNGLIEKLISKNSLAEFKSKGFTEGRIKNK